MEYQYILKALILSLDKNLMIDNLLHMNNFVILN